MHNNNQFNWEEPEDSETNKELEALRSKYITCFGTEAGKAVLEDLYRYLDQPVADPNYTHAQACCREGQNQVVRRIQQLIGEPTNVRRNKPRKPRSQSRESRGFNFRGIWRKFINIFTRRN